MLDTLTKVVSVVGGMVGVIAFAVSIYPKLEHGSLVLSIDKDVVTAPPQLTVLGSWVAANRDLFMHACQPPISIKPKNIQDPLCQMPELPEHELYNRSDFGSITVGITNGRGGNVGGGTTLRISKLKSFQGVTANSNFIPDMSKNLEEWNKQLLTSSPTQADPDNKDLLLTLPELKTGGYLRLSVYGLNSGFADADIIGLEDGAPSKVYVVRSSASKTSLLPSWVSGLAFLLFVVSGILLKRLVPGH